MHSETHYKQIIEEALAALKLGSEPVRLYEPVQYMLRLGGKRLRPVILLMSNELFTDNPLEVLNPALGIEVFHNFTLLHDDIMDKAPLRRSHETVHIKWNTDIAILSGDAMFVIACNLMMQVKSQHQKEVMDIFLKTALQVCEGQQLDMDFEIRSDVSLEDYLKMNSLKTASLLGCACYIGAICGNAEIKDARHMYEFGRNLGIAFQLHDDILDVYGDSDKFGKQVAGDILSNKKTYLLLTAIENAEGNTKEELMSWIKSNSFEPEKKINAIISIYEKLDVKEKSLKVKDFYFKAALKELESVSTSSGRKNNLMDLAGRLMERNS